MKDIYLLFFISLLTINCTNSERYNFNRCDHESVREFLDEPGLYSVLLAKDGELILEEYFNEHSDTDLTNIQSLTKGIMSMLVGIAIDHKFIHDENVPIIQFFPHQFSTVRNSEKEAITVCHILNQTSGLSWRGYREHAAWLRSADPVRYVLGKDLKHTPGTTYEYNSGATHLLSGIIHSASGQSTLSFARQYLFDPLDISTLRWEVRNGGHYDGGGFGLEMCSRDLMKIGQLLQDRGIYHGDRILSENWIIKIFDGERKVPTTWGIPGSKHGFCWYKGWIDDLEIDYGMGYGGQYIFLVAEKCMVIVVTHNYLTIRGARQQKAFIKDKLPTLVREF